MRVNIIFAIIMVVLIIISCLSLLYIYNTLIKRKLKRKNGEKLNFQMSLYISIIIAISSIGSYGFYFVRIFGDYYLYHPFSATIADNVFDLDYSDMLAQLQKNSGSKKELTIEEGLNIHLSGNSFPLVDRFVFKTEISKNNKKLDGSCEYRNEKKLDCHVEPKYKGFNHNTEYYSLRENMKALNELDNKLLFDEISDVYTIIIGFSSFKTEALQFEDIYLYEENRLEFYSNLFISKDIIRIDIETRIFRENQIFKTIIVPL